MSVARNKLNGLILEAICDGKIYTRRQIKDIIQPKLNLSQSEFEERNDTGSLKWENNIDWAINALYNNALIVRPAYGKQQITDKGKKYLSNVNTSNAQLPLNELESPFDTFERVYREINDNLSDELMDAVLEMPPDFFERLVIRLMENMGYGGYEGAGFVTKASRDGGIDGIIYEDKLGFNLIYIQAKRWAVDQVIGKPEVQKFVGALAGPPKIEKGLFITTASFSKEAQKYAEDNHLILVDGKKLTDLMIEFDVGVSTQKIYRLKKVDKDFFTGD